MLVVSSLAFAGEVKVDQLNVTIDNDQKSVIGFRTFYQKDLDPPIEFEDSFTVTSGSNYQIIIKIVTAGNYEFIDPNDLLRMAIFNLQKAACIFGKDTKYKGVGDTPYETY
jgi:hypothetical protein